MDIKALTKRVYAGEDLLEDVLNLFFDKKYHHLINKAVTDDLPMMIYDCCEGGDGLLYRALKNKGVSVVRSFLNDKDVAYESIAENSSYFVLFLNCPIDRSFFNSTPV